jgi:uncharacterized membrane protein (DUF2068 family)
MKLLGNIADLPVASLLALLPGANALVACELQRLQVTVTKTTPSGGPHLDPSLGLRAIALFKAAKGLLVLAAGSGALLLVHHDVQGLAERLVAHFNLNPASRYPRIFLQMATQATPVHLRLAAAGAFCYAALQCVEAAGLWKARRWAEWLAVFTGLIYVPIEIVALARKPGWQPLLALVSNLAIVLFLAVQLRAARKQRDGSRGNHVAGFPAPASPV